MTNGEKFKKIFKISQAQVDEGELYAYVWLPTHDAIEIPLEWWNAEYKEPTTKNNLGVDAISRKQAIEEADKLCLETGYDNEKVIEMLNDLPPATPQEPTDKIFTKADIDTIAKALNEGWELRANEVLDKLGAEIAELWHQYPMGHDYELAINRCLKVIDKHKAESEG